MKKESTELLVGQVKAIKLSKELLEKTQQKASYLRNIASKTKELPELEKRTKDLMNKEVERFESEFTYQSILPKPQLKTYLSPEFQSELKDITESHFFRQKLSGLAGVSNDQQSLKVIATKSMHESKKRHIEPLEIKQNDPRLTNMQRIRSTESSCSSTPVSTTEQSKNIKGRTFTENGSASVGPKKMTKNNIQMSIAEVTGKNKTPGKSFIYRMNTSFSSKEGKSVVVGSTDKNLPTITQNVKTEPEPIQEQPEKSKGKVAEIVPKKQKL